VGTQREHYADFVAESTSDATRAPASLLSSPTV